METAVKQKVLAPALRFPEFEESYCYKKLSSCCKIGTGNKDTQNKIENGKYPFFVRSNTVERINTYSFDGEAILTSGDGVGVGKNFHYINGKFDYHQRVYCLNEFKPGFSGNFIFHVFSEKFYKRVITLSAKNSVDSVRMNMISDMKIAFPTLPEQEKIASFLSAVDKKIQLLTQKVEALKTYKKGVMQKLFAQEIRFKQSNGEAYPDWEEKKLGEVCSFSKGKGISKQDITEQGIECIRYGELYTNYSEIITDTISKTAFSTSELVLSEANDVIIPSSGETQIDIATASCVLRSGIALGGDLNILKTTMNGVFLSYYLNNAKKFQIASLAQGSSVMHLYASQLASLKIEIPCLEEQQKIASFLGAIDQKIEATQGQLTHTQSFKKGLLQKMFV